MVDSLTFDLLPISEIPMTFHQLREPGGPSVCMRDSLAEDQELCEGLPN